MNAKKEKVEKEEQYNWWLTCIPDKIISLQKKLPDYIKDKLDCSITSLDVLENYLLENYTMESLMRDKNMWDECASYIGNTYKKNIPNAKWYIDLDNKRNIFYNMPCLQIVNKINFVPHSYVTTLLDRKEGNLLSTIVKNHINYLG